MDSGIKSSKVIKFVLSQIDVPIEDQIVIMIYFYGIPTYLFVFIKSLFQCIPDNPDRALTPHG